MNGVVVICLAAVLGLLIWAPSATAVTIGITRYSQQVSSSRAEAGGSITVSYRSPGGGGGGGGGGGESLPPAAGRVGEGGTSQSSYTTPTKSREETQCFAAQESSVSPCYGIVPASPPAVRSPGGRPARPAINPAVVAASLAGRLALEAGRIAASPSERMAGLTGAASWFWLEPAPADRSMSVALGGESVTVTARPNTVRWTFGDGSSLLAGPGVPYRPGAAPASAVRHVYQTRCLPGDRGHDPYVLASCGSGGYTVEAAVQWTIGYTASGPVAAGGALPARSTATSTVYPVSEARAFLTNAGGTR